MENSPNLGTAVRDLVFEKPASARVFETLGIDYCCGGSQTLAEACRAANRSTEEVSAALQRLDSAPSERDWRDASLTELARLQSIFEEVSAELKAHMMKEEELLFPYIAEMEEAARVKRRPPAPMFGTVQNPVAAMIMEHEAAGQAFEKMREITKGYTVPPDGCASYQALYQALPAFAADLHQHIHLENNILFPRSVELESDFG